MRSYLILLVPFGLFACASEIGGEPFVPTPDDKADITDRSDVVEHMDAPRGTFSGTLVEDFQADAYIFDGAEQMRVTVTTAGTEVNAFLYAPQFTSYGYEGYGTDDIARSHDIWALQAVLEHHAQYYLVVASPDGQGRGDYEITFDFECPPDDCLDSRLSLHSSRPSRIDQTELLAMEPCEGSCDGVTELEASSEFFGYSHGAGEYDFIAPLVFSDLLAAIADETTPEAGWNHLRQTDAASATSFLAGTNLQPFRDALTAMETEGRLVAVGELRSDDTASCSSLHSVVLHFGDREVGVVSFERTWAGCP